MKRYRVYWSKTPTNQINNPFMFERSVGVWAENQEEAIMAAVTYLKNTRGFAEIYIFPTVDEMTEAYGPFKDSEYLEQ